MSHVPGAQSDLKYRTINCTSMRLETLQLQSEAHSLMRPASKYVHYDTVHSD